jgi:hypothetical protein
LSGIAQRVDFACSCVNEVVDHEQFLARMDYVTPMRDLTNFEN